MQLSNGTLLHGGTYKIDKVLGQGGFGITYLAEQCSLKRKVCVKEFYMKNQSCRDESTSSVTLGVSSSNSEIAKMFKEKFLKEARNIAKMNHPNIVKIIDVFEENGTAYYVMEYAQGGSLADKVKILGALPEETATQYIQQVADALNYVHERKMNHLDVKPSNIMLNENDEAVLIDFGLSKQYNAGGQQTSTTPVGISEGYAPMEQYNQGGVKEFSPETDVYALGATYFYLLTGSTPPSASKINEDGLPIGLLKDKKIGKHVINVISHAMEPKRKDRTKSVCDFTSPLVVEEKRNNETWVYVIIAFFICALFAWGYVKYGYGITSENTDENVIEKELKQETEIPQKQSSNNNDILSQKENQIKENTTSEQTNKNNNTAEQNQVKSITSKKETISSISFTFGTYSGTDDGEGNGNRGIIHVTSSHTLSTNGGDLNLQPGDEIINTQIRSGKLKSGVWIHNGERTSFFR